jgi:ATP-binding cassette subfamily C protein
MTSNGKHISAIPPAICATLAAVTLAVNMLVLVQPIYMLQVYDRVVPSGSLETLGYLSIAAAGALVVLGLIDGMRSMICSRMAAQLEARLGARALVASMEGPRASIGDVQNLRDLGTVRTFLAGRGVLAFLDLPFVPLFLILLYLIHPYLFFLTLAGAVVLMLVAICNQAASGRASTQASEQSVMAMLTAQTFVRNTESARAMGMTANAISAWGKEAVATLNIQDRLNRLNAIFAGLSRALRLGLQVAILGVGGYLVVIGDMTAGMIFASSLVSGRALQPMDQIIAGWRGFSEARRCWNRLSASLDALDNRPAKTELPAPQGKLALEKVVVAPRTGGLSTQPLLGGVTAGLDAGECLVLMGASGAGKSTLARAIVGAAPLQSGAIRIDGFDIRHWDRDALGRHIGYLAQDVELLPGTVAKNIARFDPAPLSQDIMEAARKAQVHELIQTLPNGYDTFIGPGGITLSGGQKQRVGLARAFYGAPRLLVLDEPNANLDAIGEEALERALRVARADRVTVILVAQRHRISRHADKVLMLRQGTVEDFGPREEVIARQLKKIEEAKREAGSRPRTAAASASFSPVIGTRPALSWGQARAANRNADVYAKGDSEEEEGAAGEL